MTHYVSVIAFSIRQDKVVLLKKTKGPAHIVGKLTVPGGKVKEGETVWQAGSRELKEESGLDVPQHRIHFVEEFGDETFKLTVLYTLADVSDAHPQPGEDEHVFVGKLSDLISNKFDMYAEDISKLAKIAKENHAQ